MLYLRWYQYFYFLLSFCLFSLLSCSSPTKDAIKQYIEIRNIHDVAEVMTLYSEEAVYQIYGGWTREGLSNIREVEEFGAVTNSIYQIEEIKSRGDTAICKVLENNDFYGSAGLEKLEHSIRFVVRNSLIQEIIVKTTQESFLAIRDSMKVFYDWLKTERIEDWNRLVAEGKFQYGTKAAQEWMTLIREWRKITEAVKEKETQAATKTS